MSQSSPPKQRRFFTNFLLGIILGYVLGYSLPTTFSRDFPFVVVTLLPSYKFSVPVQIALLLLVALAGALGGLLYAMNEKKLELPHLEPNKANKVINPGFVSDCLAGIAGACVVFLIVPSGFDDPTAIDGSVEIIRILAIAIVGGYGGRGLMDKVLGDLIAKQIIAKVDEKTGQLAQKVEDTTKEVVQKVEDTTKDITQEVIVNRTAISNNTELLDEQGKTGARVLALLERYLDEDLEPTAGEVEEIERLVKQASPSNRIFIFVEAKKVREINARSQNKKEFMVERTIPVFEALMRADTDKQFLHRYYAQLGYALKDKKEPNWSGAEAALSEAIKIRNESPDKYESFWVYEFNRAICRINLDEKDKPSLPGVQPSVHNPILKDLRDATDPRNHAAGQFKEYLAKLDEGAKTQIGKWLTLNNLSPKDVGLSE